MSSHKIYQYKRLPNPKTHIRLLALNLDRLELAGSIEVYPASLAPPYEAVSYAWGTQKPTSFLTCGYASIAVSHHLLAGIWQIWRRAKQSPEFTTKCRLWIDAICINQHDSREKADQIPLMTQIFCDARQVLVWLGVAADGSDSFLKNLESSTKRLMVCVKYYRELYSTPSTSADWTWIKAAGNFIARPWFRRLWVVQEVVLAKHVTIVCGSCSIHWNSIILLWRGICMCSELWRHIRSNCKNPETMASGLLGLLNLVRMRSTRADRPRWNLHVLIHQTRDLETSEPIDRVYGVLGMTGDGLGIAPDYSAEAREQYWRLYLKAFTMEVTSGGGGLIFLKCADIRSRHPESPSWLPNWNCVSVSEYLCAGIYYRAGLLGSYSDVHLPTPTCLQIRGIFVGTIAAISPLTLTGGTTERESGHDEAVREMENIRHALKIYNKHNSFSSSHKPSTSFAKALIADRELDIQAPPPASYGQTTKYSQDALEDLNGYMDFLTAKASGLYVSRPFTRVDKRHMSGWKYASATIFTWRGRCFFVTDSGKPGLASEACRPGDKVCIFFGAPTPFILRPVRNKDTFILISEAYLEGVMWGEALEGRDESLDRYFLIE